MIRTNAVVTQTDLFGQDVAIKHSVLREDLAAILSMNLHNISLEEFVGFITNKFTEIIEYTDLSKGKNTCQKTSLLFNPHRLTVSTKNSKLSIFEALQHESFISGLSRAILFKEGKVKELLYQVLQLGINGVQYVNEFPPYKARQLYLDFGLGATSHILDPCAGWGGRMLGASVVSDYYECFEPSVQTYNGLVKLDNFIRSMSPTFAPTIHNLPFEDAKLENNFYDFAFTSPPYYDTENYCTEDTNSLNRYNNFEEWCAHFYIPMIQKTMYALKPGASFVLNIGSRVYPLNTVLLDNFSTIYTIIKLDNKLSGKSGLKNNTKEGETFYKITKNGTQFQNNKAKSETPNVTRRARSKKENNEE